ncbi:hypothetical protein HPP92_013788 [Vanilla planifolia]|uniref:Uncharacterized protein n=1 Tax=Vanilla planifolia TaxID=51239 RepID=A0A835QZ71_VANPL|nr:hypothetical protein HPP92_013788 [Vanilla planifolia]
MTPAHGYCLVVPRVKESNIPVKITFYVCLYRDALFMKQRLNSFQGHWVMILYLLNYNYNKVESSQCSLKSCHWEYDWQNIKTCGCTCLSLSGFTWSGEL